MTLYEILGVPENATPEQIKAAYRKLVQKWHPDRKDGNAEKFHQVQRAYDILMGEHTRELYDATGSHTTPDDERTAALTEVSGLLFTVIEQAETDDILAIMRRVIKDKQKKIAADIVQTRQEIRRYARVTKRLKVAAGKKNILAEMLAAATRKAEMSITLQEQYKRRGDLMLEILADYGYEIERAEALPYKFTTLRSPYSSDWQP